MFPSSRSLLWEGLKLAARHPWIALGICLLGTGLGGLAPLLMVKGQLGTNPPIESLFFFLALLPLDFYFLPRLALRLDAESNGQARNPLEMWQATFEARWLKAFAAKVLLGVVAGIGAILLVLPGLLVLFCFGWAPTRVLLRGERLGEACLGSLELMRRRWPQALMGALLVLTAGMSVEYAAAWALETHRPLATPWAELHSPFFWAAQFLGSAVSLWTSTCLLALYLRLESLSDSAPFTSSSEK